MKARTLLMGSINFPIVALVAAMAWGCGDGDQSGAGPPGWTPAAGPAVQVGASQPAAPGLDLRERPLLPGHVRLEGGCDGGFPFHMQHPSGWKVSASHLGVNKDRSDDVSFGIRVGDNFGFAHATSQAEVQKQSGARVVGTVTIGGQPVEVLARNDHSYTLFAPHPWGPNAVGYYWLFVESPLGEAATLDLLGTLVPVGGC